MPVPRNKREEKARPAMTRDGIDMRQGNDGDGEGKMRAGSLGA